jgi:hypothetical protein
MARSLEIMMTNTANIPANEEIRTMKKTNATLPSSSVALLRICATVRSNTTIQLHTRNVKANTIHETIERSNKLTSEFFSTKNGSIPNAILITSRVSGCICTKILFRSLALIAIFLPNEL